MENWKPVVGFEGRYEVSDQGRVRSLDRVVVKRDGEKQRITGRLLKAHIDGAGYMHVGLIKSIGVQKNVTVHKAVAQAFVPKIEGFNYIDHIDGNKHNNTVLNLRWITAGLNANHRHVARSSTGVVGVFYTPKSNARNPYKVELKMDGKSKLIGYFNNLESAKDARSKALSEQTVRVMEIKEKDNEPV